MRHLEEFEQEVTSWAGVSAHPHRFGGREFRLGDAEVGHIHAGGILDIPFPRAIRDALLDEGLAEMHHWVPNSGWITYHVRSDEDFQHGLWLARLSYLRYELKNVADSRALLEAESAQLRLSARFTLLLEPFIRQPILENVQPLTA
jgi:hypothetical protein